MAFHRLSVRVISRGNVARLTARNVVAASAYNSRAALHDERLDVTHNYASRSADLVETDLLLPPVAPYRWFDRETLWNEVEARERRSDSRLARSIILTLPRELDAEVGADLARDFFGRAFVDRGMVVDMAVHTKTASDGGPQPHAHALLTMRRIVDGAFGLTERAWNSVALLRDWREQWADMANRRLAEFGLHARLDHRHWAARSTQVREIATVARGVAIIGASLVTQAVRDAARRMGPAGRRRDAVPLDTPPPRPPVQQLREELRRPIRAAAVGVAAGVWSYGEATDRLVHAHLLPAIDRFPELEPRFEALESGIGSALAKQVQRVEERISGNAAILRQRAEQRERMQGFTRPRPVDGLGTNQAMRDLARQLGPVEQHRAVASAEHAAAQGARHLNGGNGAVRRVTERETHMSDTTKTRDQAPAATTQADRDRARRAVPAQAQAAVSADEQAQEAARRAQAAANRSHAATLG